MYYIGGSGERTSSGFSPSFLRKNQSEAVPNKTKRQNAALKPFSCPVPQLFPLLRHSLSHTSAHEEMCARRAMACTVPNAPTADIPIRTDVCCVRAIGRRHKMRPMGVKTATRMRRVRREGWSMTSNASARVELESSQSVRRESG